MNYKMMGRMCAQLLMIEGVFMLPALLIALLDGDGWVAISFLITIGIAMVISLPVWIVSRKAKSAFYARDGLISVGISWILLSVVGCLPFVISGEIPHFLDALFEIVSGFTTTGASIVTDVEALSRGILYWRSFSHWLGGMGMLVFLLAIVPASGGQGYTMHLLRAESPGPDVGKLVPKMRQTALILYCIYIVLTVLDFVFLALDMPIFDAICTAFGTAGTGGFGIRSDSLAGYSPYVQIVTTVFLTLFGINFSCYYLILLGRFKSVFKDEELHVYLGLIVASITVICLNLCRNGVFATFGETLRHSAFQVLSIVTTAGFATTDFDLWPSLSKSILLILMAIGACAGSTGGGFKVSRVILLFKIVRRGIRRVLHPNRVEVVQINGKTLDETLLHATGVYLATYVAVFLVSFLLISADFSGEGDSLITHFSAVLSCMNNIGPGFGRVGPTLSFAGYGYFSKIVLTLDMLIGRLELFPILILMFRDTWKRK